MSALHYQGVFESSVSQRTDITLAGQTDSAPVTADFTITLAVTKAQLDAALTWTGAYVAADETNAREEAFPQVTFDVESLIGLAAHSATVADFSDVTKDLLTGANSAVPTLQGRFKQIVSAFSGISEWAPANVPLEAVLKVVNNALTGNTLTQTLLNPAASSTKDSHPVSLYEQAVAADKSKATGADFAVNDSISVYVDYTLAKTRRYIMDTAAGTDEVAEVAGMTVGDGDEESATEHAIYQILFVVSA